MPNTNCWYFAGSQTQDGYGLVKIDGRTLTAHKAVYLSEGKNIPEGHEIDHLCKNRICINPDHLEAVTHLENIRRSHQEIECKNGHPYDGVNTYIRPNGTRDCRKCRTQRIRRWKERQYAFN